MRPGGVSSYYELSEAVREFEAEWDRIESAAVAPETNEMPKLERLVRLAKRLAAKSVAFRAEYEQCSTS